MRTLHGRLVAGLFALLAATSSFASPVVYQFTALSAFFGITGSFTYSAPDFLTANLDVPPMSLDSCNVKPAGFACSDMVFFVDSSPLEGSDLHDVVAFGAAVDGLILTSFFYFQNGAFGEAGNYASDVFLGQQDARLRVSVAPEPASIALVGIALTAAAACRRSRASREARAAQSRAKKKRPCGRVFRAWPSETQRAAFTMYSTAARTSASESALLPPLGGIAPLPAIAVFTSVSSPVAMRGAHAALSPNLGAPATPAP